MGQEPTGPVVGACVGVYAQQRELGEVGTTLNVRLAFLPWIITINFSLGL